jgi:hypothetical protein
VKDPRRRGDAGETPTSGGAARGGDASDPGSLRPVIRAILRHLIAHPEAKDTLDGIALWWMSDCEVEPSAVAVREAVQWLVARGVMARRSIAPDLALYGAQGEKRRDLETLLGEIEARA